MEQKTILMNYLITGTSLALCLFIGSCNDNETVDALVEADFIFKNETNELIQYNNISPVDGDTTELFTVEPNSQKLYEIRTDGSPDLTAENCCEGLLDGIQEGDGWKILVVFGEDKCIEYEGEENSKSTSNFVSETLGNNKFKFTYTFNQSEIEQADSCN